MIHNKLRASKGTWNSGITKYTLEREVGYGAEKFHCNDSAGSITTGIKAHVAIKLGEGVTNKHKQKRLALNSLPEVYMLNLGSHITI
jgi:hypothetical protein